VAQKRTFGVLSPCPVLKEELLHGAQVKMPPQCGTFKEAQQARMSGEAHPQLEL
jgi:hypothetical protein